MRHPNILVLLITLVLLTGGWPVYGASDDEPVAEAQVAESQVADTPSSLTPETVHALELALNDERHAQALYRAVMEEHGEVRPFSNIIRGERRHESFLLELFESYRLDVPPDPWLEQEMEVPATLREACVQAIEAEKANIELYDELMEGIAEADILQTFTYLRNASAEHHLPAFERCSGVASGGGRGMGPGKGRGGGCGRCQGGCGAS